MKIPTSHSCILCLDIGLRNTGIAVYSPASKQFIFKECFSTEKGEGRVSTDYTVRCRSIFRRLMEINSRYSFRLVIAELPSGGARSSRAISAMAMATAIVSCFSQASGVRLFPITPLDIKRQVKPKGGPVSKEEVQDYVEAKYGNILPSGARREHVADAIMCLPVYLSKSK